MAAPVVLVTGSTRGLGLASARAFLEQPGTRVVLNGRSRERAPAELRGSVLEADVSTEAGVDALLDAALERHGRIDTVILNAAIADSGALASRPAEELAAVVATNLVGALLMVRALLRRGIARRVIAVSSRSASHSEPSSVCYAASKRGLEAMVHALSKELSPETLTICGIRPPAMATAMTRERVAGAAFDSLPSPAQTAAAIVTLAAAPSAAVHGRVFDAEGLRRAPVAELLAASPRATWPTRRPSERAAVDAGYPDGAALLAALAAHHDRDEAELLLGAGATELLFRILETLTREDEAVVVSAPSWEPFAHRCRLLGRRLIEVPMSLGPASARHDVPALARAAEKARLVYLDSPSNPSGAGLSAQELDALLAAVPEHVPIVVDEAYVHYASDGVVRAAERSDPRLIVVRTFSKAFDLPGSRVGYAMAEPALASLLRRAAVPFLVSGGAIEDAERALGDRLQVSHTVERCRAAKHRLVEQLEPRGVRCLRSEAPFLLVEERGAPELSELAVSEHRYFDGRFLALSIRDVRALRTILAALS